MVASEVMLLAAQLPPLAYVFVGMLLVIIGVALIAFTIEIPIVNIVTSVVGWTLVLFGAFIGLIGTLGEQVALTIAGYVFAAIWGIGAIIIVLHEAKILWAR